eukprot:Lithocolla_globosa_v1_NODE_2540_length_1960_cov_4.935958.p1 type:complete len:158 gc:universal NODE_2540_length_1960_cov_4.935958:1445-1918(+)
MVDRVDYTGLLIVYSCFAFEFENGELSEFVTCHNQSFVSMAYSAILLQTCNFTWERSRFYDLPHTSFKALDKPKANCFQRLFINKSRGVVPSLSYKKSKTRSDFCVSIRDNKGKTTFLLVDHFVIAGSVVYASGHELHRMGKQENPLYLFAGNFPII